MNNPKQMRLTSGTNEEKAKTPKLEAKVKAEEPRSKP
jgi:hypothetical protein